MNDLRTLALVVGLLAAPPAAAEDVPLLLRDVNLLPRHDAVLSRSERGAVANGRLYFRITDPDVGVELAVVDTTSGALTVVDVNPGPAGSYPTALTTFGDRVLMRVEMADLGVELGIADGTTVTVLDLDPGRSGSSPDDFLDLGTGTAVFAASDSTAGREPWATSGTADSTFPIDDLYPGRQNSSPSEFVRTGGFICSAYTPDGGSEPWIFGFGFGTVEVAQGTASSFPSWFTYFPALGRVLFSADTEGSGRELWSTDGSQGHTTQVKEIEPGPTGSNPHQLRNVNGTLVFRARTTTEGFELWRSDGTDPGTTILTDAYPGAIAGSPGQTDALIGDTRLVVPLRTPAGGLEPAVTDGTTLTVLGDFLPGVAGSWFELTGAPVAAAATATRAFMGLDDGVHGLELWRTDGTPAGTALVADLASGPTSAQPQAIAADGDAFFFLAYGAGTYGVWKVGADGAPTLLTDLSLAGTESAFVDPVAVGSRVFFAASDGEAGRELWVSDGTPGGTRRVGDLVPGFTGLGPRFLAALGDRALFLGFDFTHGAELYASDGTAEGTRIVRDLEPGLDGSFPAYLASLGERVVFVANAQGLGSELWASDGTEEGTILLKDVFPGPRSGLLSESGAPKVSGDRAYVFGYDGEQRLLVTDGTPDGTVPLVGDDVVPYGSLVAFGARGALFPAQGPGETGSELWITDGSPAATRPLADLVPGPEGSNPSNVTVAGGRAFFTATTPGAGYELCVTDGTELGTRRVKDITSGPDGTNVGEMAALGDGVVFTADDVPGLELRWELWVSDGTEAGTTKLDGVCPSDHDCRPQALFAFAGAVFFNFDDGVHGYELWKTDGTVAGTVMVADSAPGDASFTYRPEAVQFLGGKIFLEGCDDAHGCEPWIFDYLGPDDQCADDPAKLAPGGCGCGVPDTDADGSGVLDCRVGDELRARLGALVALIESLEKPTTKAERRALKARLQEVRAAFAALAAYYDAHAAALPDLKAPFARAQKAVKKLTRSVRALKRARTKALGHLRALATP